MVYVALLRGINVGGHNKVEMSRLKAVFEQVGAQSVATYINSGNVVFQDSTHTPAELTKKLEAAIEEEFGFAVKVLLRSKKQIEDIVRVLPDSWVNDATTKCDIMFLWEHVAGEKILDQLAIKPEIDEVKYAGDAVLWRVDKKYVTKSGMMKLVGTELYKHMTIRNCNTVRKLFAIMKEL